MPSRGLPVMVGSRILVKAGHSSSLTAIWKRRFPFNTGQRSTPLASQMVMFPPPTPRYQKLLLPSLLPAVVRIFSTSHLRNAHQERTDPLSCLGDNQGGFTLGELYPVSLQVRSSSRGPTDPSQQQSVQTDYNTSSGRAKTNLGQTRRPQPYWTYNTRAFEHVNAVAGPSVVAHTPSVGSPTRQPYGRISETIANTVNELVAEVTNKQNDTEENKAPVSNFYRSRIPRVSD
jgi:hypothetical protein